MKISFIATVYNEEKTIESFVRSILKQSKLPDEVIITDGGSTDRTVEILKEFGKNISVFVKKGNRSLGRNEAIKHATGDIIVCTDSGNIVDPSWVKQITTPFNDKTVEVVAGYYKGIAKTIFQNCVIPYALVMPDKIDPNKFLPATRSMAFKKSIWKKVGGFNEQFSHNEDYVFAKKLEATGAKIVFAKEAIVHWIPPNTYKQAFIMMFRFAYGDIEAGIVRSKILLLFARYFLALYFVFLSSLYRSLVGLILTILVFVVYVFWSIVKNYKYVKKKEAVRILPSLQFTADASVILGTLLGLIQVARKWKPQRYMSLILFILIYLFIIFLTITWGAPNGNHPFPYHMDEWHQLQAVRSTFKFGTPNIAGAANGTMFHFILSGIYLIPFTLSHLINPFVIKIFDTDSRERLFFILRLNTLFWGVCSLVVLYSISTAINASKKFVLALFILTPLWITLSNYFKYDIAQIFWILLSILFFIRFSLIPTSRNYILAAVPAALAIATKVSAIPLFLIYTVSYFYFTKKNERNVRYYLCGIGVFLLCVLLFGTPDTLFGRGNIYDYVYNNVVQSPQGTENFILHMNTFVYLFFHEYPVIFGHGLFYLFFASVFCLVVLIIKSKIQYYKIELFLLFCFILFLVSILPLKIWAGGNRSLVLLPFATLFIGSIVSRVVSKKLFNTMILTSIISVALVIQIYESFCWEYVKYKSSPQELSSEWIQNNIPKNQTIGVENIPIYQYLPDILEKQYYYQQYHVGQNNTYYFQIVDAKSKIFSNYVVVTNDEIEQRLLATSAKKQLLARLKIDGYKKNVSFSPNLTYYHIFGTDTDFYISGIVTIPLSVSVFKK